MKRVQVTEISKDWWKKDRKPSTARELVIRARPRAGVSKKYWTIKELAERFKTSHDPWYSAIWSGELDADMIGNQYRVSDEALQEYLAKQRIKLKQRVS